MPFSMSCKDSFRCVHCDEGFVDIVIGSWNCMFYLPTIENFIRKDDNGNLLRFVKSFVRIKS